MHYNTFDAIKQDPKQFEKLVRVKAKGVKVVVLNPGESCEFARKGKKKG
jgi:L-ascorbate metabolism protein UlaG (beta-lactamase superfamily)